MSVSIRLLNEDCNKLLDEIRYDFRTNKKARRAFDLISREAAKLKRVSEAVIVTESESSC